MNKTCKCGNPLARTRSGKTMSQCEGCIKESLDAENKAAAERKALAERLEKWLVSFPRHPGACYGWYTDEFGGNKTPIWGEPGEYVAPDGVVVKILARNTEQEFDLMLARHGNGFALHAGPVGLDIYGRPHEE